MHLDNKFKCRALVSLLLACPTAWGLLSESSYVPSRLQITTERPIDFVIEIQPILQTSCIRCHGPAMQMGQLRLDSSNLALQGGISGKVIIPGKSGESLLVQRIQ